MKSNYYGRVRMRFFVISCAAWLLAGCTPYGRFTAVEVTPSPGGVLQPEDEIRAKFNYQIDSYVPGVRYAAALFFSYSGGRTVSAPLPYGFLDLEKPAGSIELTVPVSKITNPPLSLRNEATLWLYILRYYKDGGSDPVIVGGPFNYKIRAQVKSARNQP